MIRRLEVQSSGCQRYHRCNNCGTQDRVRLRVTIFPFILFLKTLQNCVHFGCNVHMFQEVVLLVSLPSPENSSIENQKPSEGGPTYLLNSLIIAREASHICLIHLLCLFFYYFYIFSRSRSLIMLRKFRACLSKNDSVRPRFRRLHLYLWLLIKKIKSN